MEILTGSMALLKFMLATTVAGGGALLMMKGKPTLASGKMGKDLGDLTGKKGFRISMKYIISAKELGKGILLISPQGGGKTTLLKANLLCDPEQMPNCSYVITDCRGDIYAECAPYLQKLGYKIYQFEPLSNETCHWNPLDFCEDYTDVVNLAGNMVKSGTRGLRDETWINMATPLIAAGMLYAKFMCEYPFNTVNYALETVLLHQWDEDGDDQLLDLFASDEYPEIYKQYMLYKQADKAGETTASIKSTLATSLRLFIDPKIMKSTMRSDFTPEIIRDEKTVVFFRYELDQSRYLDPLIATFYTLMLSRGMRYFERSDKKKQKSMFPVLFIIDEIQNIGPIMPLLDYVNYVRYNRMGLVLCVQDLSRMYEIYGRNNVQSLLGAMQIKVVFPGLSDENSTHYFSIMSGEKEVTVNNQKSTSKAKKIMYNADEVRRIEEGTVLIMAKEKLLTRDRIVYHFKDPVCRKNMEGIQ